MYWNVSLKELDENSKAQFGSQFSKKTGKKSYDSKCKTMKVKVVLKDVDNVSSYVVVFFLQVIYF